MGQWRGTGGLLLWIDVEPELQREADAWYVDEHLPERVDIAGYRSARRYVAVEGTPRYLSIFEAATPDALASDGYLRIVRSISEQSRRIRAGFSRVVRNTFQVEATEGRGRGAFVASLRLVLPAPAPTGLAVFEAAMKAAVVDLVDRHCIVGAHWLKAAPEVRAQLDAVRAVGQNDATVDYVLLVEATQTHELPDLREVARSVAGFRELRWAEEDFGIYRLMVEFSERNENP